MVFELGNAEVLGLAGLFLIVGNMIKDRVGILSRFFIPAPVIGGLLFSLIVLVGHQTHLFDFEFDNTMRDLLLIMFFTTIGFTASLEMLKKGGIAVALFIACCTLLVLLQNVIGVSLAQLLGVHPLIGLAAGSVSLTGGHGTSAAFGPLLEQKGAVGALPASLAAATWGLVAGSMIGGPLGLRLLRRRRISRPLPEADGTAAVPAEDELLTDDADNEGAGPETPAAEGPQGPLDRAARRQPVSLLAVIFLCFAIGIGGAVYAVLEDHHITIPAYLTAMVVAAIIRNYIDWRGHRFPVREMETISEISLGFFLVLALMSMKLWELADIFGPILIILVVQTIVVFFFAYYITYLIMGRDYDAATLAVGHCGVGLGATPNAMANIQAFTLANGPSPKAFFVIPIVGSLFIDFINAIVITVFVNVFA